jgi:hypothetical protein
MFHIYYDSINTIDQIENQKYRSDPSCSVIWILSSNMANRVLALSFHVGYKISWYITNDRETFRDNHQSNSTLLYRYIDMYSNKYHPSIMKYIIILQKPAVILTLRTYYM